VKSKPLVLREAAARDVDNALDYYLGEGGEFLAAKFIEALEKAFQHIGKYPGAGSPRYAIELDLPDVRVHLIRRFPYLIFYIDQEMQVDVWRLLHGQRDIPASLRTIESNPPPA